MSHFGKLQLKRWGQTLESPGGRFLLLWCSVSECQHVLQLDTDLEIIWVSSPVLLIGKPECRVRNGFLKVEQPVSAKRQEFSLVCLGHIPLQLVGKLKELRG